MQQPPPRTFDILPEGRISFPTGAAPHIVKEVKARHFEKKAAPVIMTGCTNEA
jgi:hypothetical protein